MADIADQGCRGGLCLAPLHSLPRLLSAAANDNKSGYLYATWHVACAAPSLRAAVAASPADASPAALASIELSFHVIGSFVRGFVARIYLSFFLS